MNTDTAINSGRNVMRDSSQIEPVKVIIGLAFSFSLLTPKVII